MTVKQLKELLEEFGDHLEVKLDIGEEQGPQELDLDHNNCWIDDGGDLVISL